MGIEGRKDGDHDERDEARRRRHAHAVGPGPRHTPDARDRRPQEVDEGAEHENAAAPEEPHMTALDEDPDPPRLVGRRDAGRGPDAQEPVPALGDLRKEVGLEVLDPVDPARRNAVLRVEPGQAPVEEGLEREGSDERKRDEGGDRPGDPPHEDAERDDTDHERQHARELARGQRAQQQQRADRDEERPPRRAREDEPDGDCEVEGQDVGHGLRRRNRGRSPQVRDGALLVEGRVVGSKELGHPKEPEDLEDADRGHDAPGAEREPEADRHVAHRPDAGADDEVEHEVLPQGQRMEEVVLRDVHPARRHPEEGQHRAGGREQGDRAVHPAEPRPERAPADERDRKTGEEPGDHHEQEHLVRAQQGDHRAAVDPHDDRRQGRDEERGERRVHGHRDGERDRRGPDDGQGGVGGGERGQGDAREKRPGAEERQGVAEERRRVTMPCCARHAPPRAR